MGKAIWIALLAAVISCQAVVPPPTAQSPQSTSGVVFTYSTLAGGVWQVDLEGHKTNLLPDDHIQKWYLSWSPDRRTLVYSARYYQALGVEQSLFAFTLPTKQPKRLLGPVTNIVYEWMDNPRLLRVWSSERRLTTPTPSNQGFESGKWFQVDVETSQSIEIKMPNPDSAGLLKSPNGKWSLAVEPEGDKMVVYLLDAAENKDAKVYEQPADQRYFSGHWSPDNNFVAYVLRQEDSSDLYMFRLKDKSSTKITHFSETKQLSLLTDLQWSPNSDWLLFSVWSKLSASQLCLVHGIDYDIRCFEVFEKSNQFIWSTDSRYVAFFAPITDARLHDIYVLEAATGEVRNLTRDGDAQIEDWIAP